MINLLLIGRRDAPGRIGVVTLGAVLPDLPIVGFYLWYRLLLDRSEATIWTSLYPAAGWQAVFDGFHSLVLLLPALALAAAWRSTALTALLASMNLHAVLDLPLHHGDAHRHFFPLSDWTWASPVSYWNPAHYGEVAAAAEAAAVIAATAWLWRCYESGTSRSILAAAVAAYAGGRLFAVVAWG